MTDLPISANGVLSLHPSTQDEINRFANLLIQSVKNGEENALKLHVQLKAFEKVIEIVKDKIKDNVLKEADTHPEREFECYGSKIEKAEVGTKYDYSKCQDPIWEHRNAIVYAAQVQLKEREAFLKSLREPMTIVDDESGEVVTVRPPVKTSQSGIKVSIK